MIFKDQYNPKIYYLITFLITYVLWFAGAYFSYQPDANGLYVLFMLPELMTPFLVSVLMIMLSKNADMKKDFFNRLFNPKIIQIKMLPVLFLLMPLGVLISIAISLVFGESASQFKLAEGFSFSSGIVPVLLLLILAASFEELGWRGYAFDSLQSRYNLFKASIIFGVLWSFWHFPLVFVKNSYQYEICQENIWFGLNFFVSIIPLGIIISWMCLKNNKSVIAAILFHFIVNISQEMFAISQITKSIETVVLVVIASVIVLLDREMFFSRKRHFEKQCSN